MTANASIKARLAELQSKSAERALVTIESLTDELEEARFLGIKEGQPAAAIAATMGKAKLHGKLVDTVEIKHLYAEMTDDELDREYEQAWAASATEH